MIKISEVRMGEKRYIRVCMNTMVIGYTTVVTIIQIIVSGGKLSTWKQGVPIIMRTLRKT